jgi:hypothetical protein
MIAGVTPIQTRRAAYRQFLNAPHNDSVAQFHSFGCVQIAGIFA